MKKTKILSLFLALILCFSVLFAFVSCEEETAEEPKTTAEEQKAVTQKNEIPAEGIWKEATYRSPKTLGEGKTEFSLKVIAEEQTLSFTVKTDEENLGKALVKSGIVEGEEGAYGLYIKKVNGMLADYDVNQTYWSFSIDGQAQMTGVSAVTLKGGETFELVLSK